MKSPPNLRMRTSYRRARTVSRAFACLRRYASGSEPSPSISGRGALHDHGLLSTYLHANDPPPSSGAMCQVSQQDPESTSVVWGYKGPVHRPLAFAKDAGVHCRAPRDRRENRALGLPRVDHPAELFRTDSSRARPGPSLGFRGRPATNVVHAGDGAGDAAVLSPTP